MVSTPPARHKGAGDFIFFAEFGISAGTEMTRNRPGFWLNAGPSGDRSYVPVKTSIAPPKVHAPTARARGRARPRVPYDGRWWGREGQVGAGELPYWSLTRRPLPCLAFVLPILLLYEVGILWLGGDQAEALRTGVDAWVRQGLGSIGLTDRWLPPLVLVVALALWQAADRRAWRFRPGCLVGMAVESLVLAVVLIGLSRVVDLGLVHLDDARRLLGVEAGPSPDAEAARRAFGPTLGYLGAGVYEEAIFRLGLIPLFYYSLRVMLTPRVLAGALAVSGSAVLFSIAHHAGAPGEAFTWYAFFFRWVAGIFFAWVFVARGFGVAVGTHAAYDILVGWLYPGP
jgi:hypothetical protein